MSNIQIQINQLNKNFAKMKYINKQNLPSLLRITNFIYTYGSIFGIQLKFSSKQLSYAMNCKFKLPKYNKLQMTIVQSLVNYILQAKQIYEYIHSPVIALLAQANKLNIKYNTSNILMAVILELISAFFPNDLSQFKNLKQIFQENDFDIKVNLIIALIQIVFEQNTFKNNFKKIDTKFDFFKQLISKVPKDQRQKQSIEQIQSLQRFYNHGTVKMLGTYYDKSQHKVQLFCFLEDKNAVYMVDSQQNIEILTTEAKIKSIALKIGNSQNISEKKLLVELYHLLKNKQFIEMSMEECDKIQQNQDIGVWQKDQYLKTIKENLLISQKQYSKYLDEYWGSRWLDIQNRKKFINEIQYADTIEKVKPLFFQFINNHGNLEILYEDIPPKSKYYERKYSVIQMQKRNKYTIKNFKINILKGIQQIFKGLEQYTYDIYTTESLLYISSIIQQKKISEYIEKLMLRLNKLRKQSKRNHSQKSSRQLSVSSFDSFDYKSNYEQLFNQKKQEDNDTFTKYEYKKRFGKSKKMIIQQ